MKGKRLKEQTCGEILKEFMFARAKMFVYFAKALIQRELTQTDTLSARATVCCVRKSRNPLKYMVGATGFKVSDLLLVRRICIFYLTLYISTISV